MIPRHDALKTPFEGVNIDTVRERYGKNCNNVTMKQ